MSLRSLACLSALCAALSGCPDDEQANDVPPGQVDPNGPSTPQPGDPNGPGVEPPETMMPGPGTTAGTAAAPPTSGAPSDPTASGGQAGSGDMSSGPPTVVADAGAEPEPCASLADCALDTPCTDSQLHCITLPSCGGTKCVDPMQGCELECGPGVECSVLESYPEQLRCGN